jgi:subtilisin family serine protease
MPGAKKVWSLWLLPLIVLCPRLPAQDGPLIALRSAVIDTRQPRPEIPEALRVRPEDAAEDEVVLVKFPAPPTERQVAALRAASLRIYAYLPYYTYLVRMPAGGVLPAKVGASWSGPYHPLYKISPEIAAVVADAKSQGGFQPVLIQVYPDADLDAVVGRIRDLGAKGIVGFRRNPFFSRVRLLLSSAEIAALREPLAGLRDVFWIDLEGRRTLRNDTTVWVGQSGLAGGEATPVFAHGIYGQGQTVGVLDTGIDADTCYFRDPVRGLPAVNACDGGTAVDAGQRKVLAVDFLDPGECANGISAAEWDNHGHGTHVAGTAAGDDLAHLLLHDGGDGMAPGARLIIQDGGVKTDNCGDLPGIGCPVVDLNPIFLQAYRQGARLHTNSWGDNENAAVQNNYSAGSQDVDEFMWNHKDFLIFFAAGNSGPGTGSVGSPSTAKSAVSVGATQRAESADSMAGFSSCGPTADGRIKPEITVPGVSIRSAATDGNVTTDNCGTISFSGTSMASPGAAGLAALIRQYYTEGWYPGGKRNRARSLNPSAALLRATLVNSAVNMAGTQAIPANCQGWGRAELDRALYFTGQTRKLWVKDDAASFATGSAGQERVYSFAVAAGAPLKVTLAWTDFPSTPAASVNLNNDLDLIVTGPKGAVWRGNVFAAGASAAGGAADRRNTLEQVLLTRPAAGTYKVTVRSFNVPNGPQPFALVVTGKKLQAR